MTKTERILLFTIIGASVASLALVAWGAVWLRAEFQQQDQRQVQYALRHICAENPLYC